jgi:hypothetical protein
MINFCHISPTKYLERYTEHNGAHLILAHLVESDPEYRDFYANLDDGKYKIMDNSAFEMFKLGRPMYDSSKLVDMGKMCNANCIVMSDYPKSHSSVTRKAAEEMIPQLKGEGFDTFFCPQSGLGDIEDLLDAIEWGLDNEDVDLIGMSILACPIALGVNESTFDAGGRSDAYKMQRFMSRFTVFDMLERRGSLNEKALKRFHCLGMVDGPREIRLLSRFEKYIFSWDSSAAVWAGIHGIMFDGSPTGLANGKFEKEVEFGYQGHVNNLAVYHNIEYINQLLK